ncbi:MAG: hypothetical protein HYY96_17480 [Candidatus Tectomicrobia bacterium]|nr:hypothetical protein [Candidatus Tectomicrobia bacterium]
MRKEMFKGVAMAAALLFMVGFGTIARADDYFSSADILFVEQLKLEAAELTAAATMRGSAVRVAETSAKQPGADKVMSDGSRAAAQVSSPEQSSLDSYLLRQEQAIFLMPANF